MHEKTYNISQEFYAACNLLNVESHQVLKQMGLPSNSIHHADLNFTAGQVAKVFEVIVTLYGKDDFHIKLADGFSKAAFGHAFLALQCSENLYNGVYRVSRFKEIIEPVKWQISETKEMLRISLQAISEDFPIMGVGQIMSFLWLVKSARNVSAKHIKPCFISITDPVPHQAHIEQDLDCEIRISDRAYIEFLLTDLEHPILSMNRFVTSGLDAGADKVRVNAAKDGNFISAVYNIVTELLPSGVVTSERVAKRLALGKRTLERRLYEQGCSFTEIVRHCRQDMARHYLHDTRLPISEISLLLGYREINSFYRAFKDWFDCTPYDIRNRQQE